MSLNSKVKEQYTCNKLYMYGKKEQFNDFTP